MSVEERKDEFINELRNVLQQGDSVSKWRRQFRREYKSELESKGLDFNTFYNEILTAAKEEGGSDNNAIIVAMNNLLKFIIDDNGNELTYDKLRTVDVDDITPNRKLIEETGLTSSILETQSDNLIKQAKEAGLPNTKIIEEIFERVSYLLASQDDSELEDSIQMNLEDFFEDLTQVNLKLAKDRVKLYRFWKNVNKEYPKFIEAIDEFAEACEGTPLEEGASKLAEYKPDNYVIKVAPQPITLDKKEIRLFDILESLGGTISGEARQEWMTRRQIAEDKERGDSKDYNWQTGDEKYNLKPLGDGAIEHIRQLSDRSTNVDPIMAYIYKDLDTPVGMEELGYFTRRLESLLSGASPNAAKKIEDVILKLKSESANWADDAYLPMGDWLANFFKTTHGTKGIKVKTERGGNKITSGEHELQGELQRFDRVAEGTEKWFEDLQELLYEKQTADELYAQYPLEQKPDSPRSQGPHVSSPKNRDEGELGTMDPQRSQGLLEPKKKEIPPKVEKALKDLKRYLNRYYFQPLDSGYFVKEQTGKYEIIQSGKILPSIERLVKPILSSGSTQGQAYKMLRYELGDSSSIRAERDLLEGAVDNLDTLTLTKLTNFFKEANQGKKHENWNEYVDSVEGAVKLLNHIFPDDKKDNKVWAAKAIARTLERRTEPNEEGHKWIMQDVKLGNDNIIDIMNLQVTKDPISNLVTLLQSEAIGPYIALKEEYQKDEANKLNESIEKLLEVLMTFTKSMTINHAILNVHDAIRKMEGKTIEYGFLQTNDIEDMDYLINKIYMTINLKLMLWKFPVLLILFLHMIRFLNNME